MVATPDASIGVVEALIGLRFPDDHRRLLRQHQHWSTAYGEVVLEYFSIEEIRTRYLHALHDTRSALVDFIPFAVDENGQLFGYDRRVDPSPVVMMDRAAADWSAAKIQGRNFAGFVHRLQVGTGLDHSTTYAGPAS